MRGKKDSAKQDAKTTDNKVGNAQERVFAAHDGACRYEN
jgi:hypothetical protein